MCVCALTKDQDRKERISKKKTECDAICHMWLSGFVCVRVLDIFTNPMRGNPIINNVSKMKL